MLYLSVDTIISTALESYVSRMHSVVTSACGPVMTGSPDASSAVRIVTQPGETPYGAQTWHCS